jgi:hypothetical protein
MIEVVMARRSHVNHIANHMSAIDRIECSVFGHSPKEALRFALVTSMIAWTVMINGKPEAMMGANTLSLIEGSGRPWLLMTDIARRQSITLLRLGRIYTEALHRQYRFLHNWVHADNDKAIRWLSRLGFVVGAVEVIRGQPMRPFSKVQTDV